MAAMARGRFPRAWPLAAAAVLAAAVLIAAESYLAEEPGPERSSLTPTRRADLVEQVLLGHRMWVPRGHRLEVFADGLTRPRLMAVAPDGTLHVTEPHPGRVLALPDRDGDGRADARVVVRAGLEFPHGLAFHDGALYIAEGTRVTRFRDGAAQILVSGIPTGGHVTRTIAIRDGKLYLSAGSSCNVCEERDRRRAAVVRYNLDGSGEEILAEGLRNTVGIVFGPDGKLWGTDNGRDMLGDDEPPEEVNIIERGRHYGWPYCYGDRIGDRDFSHRNRAFCAATQPPAVAIQAHSAPLGLRWGPDGALYVALHGSWNRSIPTGYKVIRIVRRDAGYEVLDHVTGWLEGEGRADAKAWGRPVDVIFDRAGTLYISDDFAGIIYRLLRAR
ncbi:MAG: PQQ-dependent sugar dehydrogenase [Armatimonadetes bacterium]|nr:PQQ-dependent sugar dehydrogenase [Armatimonadota bacterium]